MIRLCLTASCLAGLGSIALADEVIYGNNAGFGPDIVSAVDITTGKVISNLDVSPGNGRGVVQVNNTLYTTTSSSNTVHAYNLLTNTSSVAFTVSGASALSTISYNGKDFFIGDYSGTNHVYEYAPNGTLLKTISLSLCTGYCDGVAYLAANGGEIISNEFDGYDSNSKYDIYNLNGGLVKAGFIDSSSGCSTPGSSGLAYDGTHFFVSCINQSALAEYSDNGTYIKTIAFTGDTNGDGALLEGISANYAVVLTPSPEPAGIALIAVGLIALGLFSFSKKRQCS